MMYEIYFERLDDCKWLLEINEAFGPHTKRVYKDLSDVREWLR